MSMSSMSLVPTLEGTGNEKCGSDRVQDEPLDSPPPLHRNTPQQAASLAS